MRLTFIDLLAKHNLIQTQKCAHLNLSLTFIPTVFT